MQTKRFLSTSLLAASAAVLCALTLTAAHADTFGSGGNAFTIDFVNIGNAGNGNDAGAGGGLYSSPYGGVPYTYRMGVTEVPQEWITKATNLGMANVTAGAWTGLQPAATMTWYEAAVFVNFLNTSKGHQPAYALSFNGGWSMGYWSSADAWQLGGENVYRHKDAHFFLPSEDEWYKAAFHKNDGVTANYWDYATASNTIPTAVASGTGAGTAVYNEVAAFPAAVGNNGGLGAYGTRGQGGNVTEWLESAVDGINNSPSEDRVLRGGTWDDPVGSGSLRSSDRGSLGPTVENGFIGFRVASVPEPSCAVLMLGSGLVLLARRRRERSL